jgi:hypothetical protein
MANKRDWTWFDGVEKPQGRDLEALQAQIEFVVREINQAEAEDEDRRFMRQFLIEEGSWYDEEADGDTDEERHRSLAVAEARDKIAALQRMARLELLHQYLHELGARMMRPYEHHNEFERYYAIMEA